MPSMTHQDLFDPPRRSALSCTYISEPDKNALATFDVHIPIRKAQSSHSQTSHSQQSNSQSSQSQCLWVIYIHGGAWRDPRRTSRDIEASLTRFFDEDDPRTANIAGVISINYSLSPHPDFESGPDNAGKNAKHPRHIGDIVLALSFVIQEFQIGNDYILVGHSCGATLALQAFLPQTWLSEEIITSSDADTAYPMPRHSPPRPRAIILLNGLYDLRSLVVNPGEKHAHLTPIYKDFVTRAFGPDQTTWDAVSPTQVLVQIPSKHPDQSQAKQMLIHIGSSNDDTLVPSNQSGPLSDALVAVSKGGTGLGLFSTYVSATIGDHNDVWEKGSEKRHLADIVLGDVSWVLEHMDTVT